MGYTFFSKLSLKVDIPFIVNNEEDFYTFYKGAYKKTGVPDFVSEVINSTKTVNVFSEKGSKIYVLSVAIYIEEVKFTLIFKDNNDFSNLSLFLKMLIESFYSTDFDLSYTSREIEMLREEFSECERELVDYQNKFFTTEEQLSKKNLELDGYIESVNVLRKSRIKMLKLIDGIEMPLFSVDNSFELVNVNRAVGVFTGEEKLSHFIGCKCFRLIFAQESICPWCRFEDVITSKSSICQHINISQKDKEQIYEHVMFPIFDASGEVAEVGESLNDITENYELIENLKKTKDQILKVSKDKINSINEINILKSEFERLDEAYELSKQKVNKLSVALQKIMEQSNVKEFLVLKNENLGLKREVKRYSDIFSNYKSAGEKKQIEMLEISRKSALSIERLINIIDKRKTISDAELTKVFDILKFQIEEIKNKLNKEGTNDYKGSN